MLFKSRSEEIKKDISRAISIMWYVAKLYIKSMFAFWGVFFLLAVKAHRNPFVEFQKYSGNEFYATITINKPPLGIAKKKEFGENEKKRKDGAVKESPENKVK